ncbi:MAG: calcium-binding protein, partial [Microvirga sp.]
GQQGINWTWWSWNPNSGDTGGILTDDWTNVRQDKLDQLSSLLSRIFTGSAGDDVLNGSVYADSLAGLQGSDRLYGRDGDDDLDGGPGADYMVGGAGNDTYHVDHPDDQVIESYGGGNDTVLTQVSYALGSFVETLASADGAGTAGLSLTGNDDPNTLIGDAGANTLDGRGGGDTLQGLAGNDTYLVDNAFDVVIETAGGGYDMVKTSVSFALSPSSEVEYLAALSEGDATALDLIGSDTANLIIGNAGKNSLSGLGGNDRIYAGGGNDRVNGGLGDDVLFGQWGKDTLVGGAGRDAFVFDARPNPANLDRILDFVVRDDSIYLDNAVFKALGRKGSLAQPSKLKKDAFFAGSASHDASDRILYDGKSGTLSYDKDGTGPAAAIKVAILGKHLKIKATDFFVI